MSNQILDRAQKLVYAIRSGDVHCYCFMSTEQKQEDQLGHSQGCQWQNYVAEIYRIGRSDDEALSGETRSGKYRVVFERGGPRAGSGGPDYLNAALEPWERSWDE